MKKKIVKASNKSTETVRDFIYKLPGVNYLSTFMPPFREKDLYVRKQFSSNKIILSFDSTQEGEISKKILQSFFMRPLPCTAEEIGALPTGHNYMDTFVIPMNSIDCMMKDLQLCIYSSLIILETQLEFLYED